MPPRPHSVLRGLYADLGVAKDSTQADIKRSYHELVLRVHPDKQGDLAEFRKVQEAYETLRDPVKRQQYDEQRQAHIKDDDGYSRYGYYSNDARDDYDDIRAFMEIILQAQARANAAYNARAAKNKQREEMQKQRIIELQEKARANAIMQEDRIHERLATKSGKKSKTQTPSRKNCACQGCRDRFIRESNERNEAKNDPVAYALRMRIRGSIDARKEHEAAEQERRDEQRRADEQRTTERIVEQTKLAQEMAAAEQAARERLHQQIAEEKVKQKVVERLAQEVAERKAREAAEHEAEEAVHRREAYREKEQGHSATAVDGKPPPGSKLDLALKYIRAQKDNFVKGLLDRGLHVPGEGMPIELGFANSGFAYECHCCKYKKPKFTFRCPEGGAIFCSLCKKAYSVVTPMDEELCTLPDSQN